MVGPGDDHDGFAPFVAEHEPRLRRALAASFDPVLAAEASAAAFSWAWETWPRARDLTNPIAYLFKVGRSSLRLDRLREHPTERLPDATVEGPPVDPDLERALDDLTEQQRAAVVLVHGFGWTLAETAAVLDISVSTVRNHTRRGIAKLHAALEEHTDA